MSKGQNFLVSTTARNQKVNDIEQFHKLSRPLMQGFTAVASGEVGHSTSDVAGY